VSAYPIAKSYNTLNLVFYRATFKQSGTVKHWISRINSFLFFVSLTVGCARHAIADTGDNVGAPTGKPSPAFPLTTKGRWIVDQKGQRVKLHGTNWYGGSDGWSVVGGLDHNSVAKVVKLIRELGFNSVRLPFSNAMLHMTETSAEAIKANPQLAGKSPLEVFDATVAELSAQGIYVVLNNHTTSSVWCCGWDTNALWFNDDQSTEQFMADWEAIIARYKNNPWVIGADLRNEIRSGPTGEPNWGHGDDRDWHKISEILGNRLLRINPDLLIIVEGLNYATDFSGLATKPVQLSLPNHVIYSPHNYSWFGGDLKKLNYESMRDGLDKGWGFIFKGKNGLQAPVWVSEFGAGPKDDPKWLNYFVRYLRENDLDWCMWPLNNGVRGGNGSVEEWGVITPDWQRRLTDWRTKVLDTIQK